MSLTLRSPLTEKNFVGEIVIIPRQNRGFGMTTIARVFQHPETDDADCYLEAPPGRSLPDDLKHLNRAPLPDIIAAAEIKEERRMYLPKPKPESDARASTGFST